MDALSSPTILIVTPDVVGKKMAGPGLRYVEIAKSLAEQHFSVIFAIGIEGSTAPQFENQLITVRHYNNLDTLKNIIDDCSAIFCQFVDTNAIRYALSHQKRVIYDFYNVLPIETVGAERISGYTAAADKDREFKELLSYFSFCAQTGSYFVTSNDRQRDFWMGYLMANRAILPSNLDCREINDFLGLVPFGLDSKSPEQTSHGLRGHYGIAKNDLILLWCGGIWDWFDAETPIKAVAELSKTHPHIKLVFYGTTHPNKNIGTPRNVTRAIALAKKLNLYQKNIIFHEGWVPAAERGNYLLDADIAISTHLQSLETHYAFRTRILDHFWAGLPTIATRGDWFTTYIEQHKLGIGVNDHDIAAVKKAIMQLSNPKERDLIKSRLVNIRPDWEWNTTTQPLVEMLRRVNKLSVRPLPEQQATDLNHINLIGYLKQTKVISRLKQTRLWPAIRFIKRHLHR